MKHVGLAVLVMLLFVLSPLPSIFKISAQDGGKLVFISERNSLYTIDVANADGSDRQTLLNIEDGLNQAVAYSPDGEYIAFCSRRDGNWEIYMANADGSDPHRLTDNSASDCNPDWSPDGKALAFQSYRNENGGSSIYIMELDDANIHRLTLDDNVADSFPKWSPDGTKILYQSNRDEDFEVYVINVDGTEQTRLTDAPDFDGDASWSPDGQHIVFQTFREQDAGEIYVMDADGGNPQPLTSSDDINVDFPVYSPDGNSIVYLAYIPDMGSYQVYMMDADGSNQRSVVECEVDCYFPAWFPDGSMIAFSVIATVPQVFVMNADGSEQQALTDAETGGRNPIWSPDGQYIAFASNGQIYVMDADGANLQAIATGREPAWSPDSARLAFINRDENGVATIFSVNIDGSDQQRITPPEANCRFPAWSPDGSQIAFRMANEAGAVIGVVDVETGEVHALTAEGTFDDTPAWSPDGSMIAFISERDTSRSGEVYVMNADGSDQKRLTNNHANDLFVDWSADGTHLIYTSDLYGEFALFSIALDGSDMQVISNQVDYMARSLRQ